MSPGPQSSSYPTISRNRLPPPQTSSSKIMAEAVVTLLLERLATLALDKVGEEFRLVTGVEKEVKNLIHNLKAIQAVLEDAEQKQVTEATVRLWLADLSEVSNDMENVLDEWSTELLKQQMEKDERQGENALAVVKQKKVCLPFLSSCFCFGQVNHLMLRRDIAVRIKELSESIDLIAKEKKNFSLQNLDLIAREKQNSSSQNFTRVPDLPKPQKTTSFPNDKTFGRDLEKNLVVSKLLSEGSEGNQVPLVIPIVGMGGMGKTSLINLVYNDEKVVSHFDKRIWVCVSDPFEEIKIFKAIIEGLDKDSTSKNSNELETLMQCIFELIKGRKFLLVLDDVWSPNSRQWEELIKPLRHGAMGSRVLVTTRNEEVATLMKATTQMIPLKKLSEAFCLSLFYYSADMNEGGISREFQDIALAFVKKCNGLPLAAKSLGSLMRNKKKIQEWRAILMSKIWELKEIQQDVFQPLLLSYHDLTPATKRCLLYCAAFPKDYVYNRTRLVEWWMSQDYLHAEGNKGKMAQGQDHFNDLVMRSFFQDVKVEENISNVWYENVTCKIHDIVHDFLQYLTKNECFILDLELDASEKREVSTDKVYHLTLIHASKKDSFLSCLHNCKRLRTLTLIDPSDDFLCSIFELVVELKFLKTVNLCQKYNNSCRVCLTKIPETLGRLLHLRYLDLSGNINLEKLPEAMGRLYNLQTLRLVGCGSLKKIDVERLINLRHLYVKECLTLKLIKGIEKLKYLETLDEFRVGTGDEENKLEDLKELNQLQGLLEIRVVGKLNEEENAIVRSKVHLSHLILSIWTNPYIFEGDGEFMDSLEPHPDLESLTILYHVAAFPDWLSSLHGLRMLSLELCEHTVLPPLGKLSSLESLRICGLDGVEKVGVGFLGIESSSIFISFPKLQHLEFYSMGSWEEWEGVGNKNITIMPCLSELRIVECPKLKALPDFLWETPIQKWVINSSPILENLYYGK